MSEKELQNYAITDKQKNLKQPEIVKKRFAFKSGDKQKRIMQYAAAALGFVSELIHLSLLPEQYEIFIGYGIIFLLIAMAQGIIGANLLFGLGRRILTFGIRVNLVIAFVYLFTHIIGVIVGLAFMQLPLDVSGVIATLAEIALIVQLYILRRDFPKVKKAKKISKKRG